MSMGQTKNQYDERQGYNDTDARTNGDTKKCVFENSHTTFHMHLVLLHVIHLLHCNVGITVVICYRIVGLSIG